MTRASLSSSMHSRRSSTLPTHARRRAQRYRNPLFQSGPRLISVAQAAGGTARLARQLNGHTACCTTRGSRHDTRQGREPRTTGDRGAATADYGRFGLLRFSRSASNRSFTACAATIAATGAITRALVKQWLGRRGSGT